MDRLSCSYPSEKQRCFFLGAKPHGIDEESPFFLSGSRCSVREVMGQLRCFANDAELPPADVWLLGFLSPLWSIDLYCQGKQGDRTGTHYIRILLAQVLKTPTRRQC